MSRRLPTGYHQSAVDPQIVDFDTFRRRCAGHTPEIQRARYEMYKRCWRESHQAQEIQQ